MQYRYSSALAENFPGEGKSNGKKTENSKKKAENSTIKPFQWEGGNEK